MRVCVTGAAGFVGRRVVRAALARGLTVDAVDLVAGPAADGVRWHRADAGACEAVRGAGGVVHCAARADIRHDWDSLADREDSWRRGPELVWRVLESMRGDGSGPPAFVLASSACVYGGGRVTSDTVARGGGGIYGAGKMAAEQLVRAHTEAGRVRGTSVRLVSLVGPGYWHGHVADFARQALETGCVRPLDDGTQFKSYRHVDDAAEILLDAVLAPYVAGLVGRRADVIYVGGPLWSWPDTVDVMRESRPLDVIPNQTRRSAWVGDPIDLDVDYTGPVRDVAEGVREALASCGWPPGPTRSEWPGSA